LRTAGVKPRRAEVSHWRYMWNHIVWIAACARHG